MILRNNGPRGVLFTRNAKAILVGLSVFLGLAVATGQVDSTRAATLLDLSGLTWIEGDIFLGIHDAKDNTEKHDWPRVSFVHLPQSELQGVTWQVAELEYPGPPGRSSDMESVSRIPDNRGFLLCESGQEGPGDRRIFHVVMHEGVLSIDSYINWPVPVTNVEATEVHQVGGQLIFLYAERADGLRSTNLRWAKLSLDPLRFGGFSEITYAGVDPVGEGSRPIVGLDVDSDGLIYSVSAYDSGNDGGPYRSVVWRIGRVAVDEDGEPVVELGDVQRLATLDGVKVESVTVRELANGEKQVFVGSDDEHFGGIIRLLP